jgi:hypothetical protein
MNKKQKIKEQLELLEKSLANAEEYIEQGVNVEGSGPLHLDDWNGKSGHPLWIKNFMIPVIKKYKAKKEEALEKLSSKERDKNLKRRKRQKDGQ